MGNKWIYCKICIETFNTEVYDRCPGCVYQEEKDKQEQIRINKEFERLENERLENKHLKTCKDLRKKIKEKMKKDPKRVRRIGFFGATGSGKSTLANSFNQIFYNDPSLKGLFVSGNSGRTTVKVDTNQRIPQLAFYDIPGLEISEGHDNVVRDALTSGIESETHYDELGNGTYKTNEEHKLDFAIIVISGTKAWINGGYNEAYLSLFKRYFEGFGNKIYYIITKKDLSEDVPDDVLPPQSIPHRIKFEQRQKIR